MIDNISQTFYNDSVHSQGVRFMSIVYHQAQKQKYRITLELDVMEDFDPHNINWDELFDMGGDEHCEAYVEDLSRPYSW